ncbi:tol-pal system protein YbgF [Jiella sp. MQZ9-1]|uniref:Cell division coordinator CpoB n=1 Tax=Jiella flava TaxID=2816857 RepID=A0A939JVC0_9HYPH|nr:tol-pal system protein YbgF [Jiella flava]MCD2472627.1 tol-pal system protein YbgF [Jiella flava]
MTKVTISPRRLVAAVAVLASLTPSAASAFGLSGIFDNAAGTRVPTADTAPLYGRAQDNAPRRAPVQLAQAGDALVRLNQLEDEVRQLNGKVEDLRFQLLQAEENMRKYREDTEFRFQQLEGGGGKTPAASSGGDGRRGDAGTAGATDGSATASNGAGDDGIGKLLQNGIDTSSIGGQASGSASADGGSAKQRSDTVANIDPKGQSEMYDLAYNYLLAGDYARAEQSFRQYSQTYPNAKDAPDADYWLGESLYQQQKYADAAEVFLDAQKSHPNSAKAPEMMLKLGMSLAKLKNRDTACVTYKEVARRYPNMSVNVKRKLKDEESAASC